MDQHTFVRQCQERYAEEGAHPGDGDDWEEAHYPLPRGLGDETICLRHDDHQIQGLLQSEEIGQRRFWSADALRFLKTGPFVDGWFELWDLYDKWAGPAGFPEDHGEKTRIGMFCNTTPEERSEKAKIREASKTEEEKRARAQKGAAKMLANSTTKERSKRAKKAMARLTQEQLSKRVRKAWQSRSSKRNAILVTDINSGDVFLFPSIAEAARSLCLTPNSLLKVLKGKRNKHKGHTAEFFPGPNPFYT